MKCPICHGKGRIQDHKYNEEHDIEYLVYCEKKCEYCNGTGKMQMTNEEWFASLSTEEKAKTIVCLEVNALHKWKEGLVEDDVAEIKRWLEEKHK